MQENQTYSSRVLPRTSFESISRILLLLDFHDAVFRFSCLNNLDPFRDVECVCDITKFLHLSLVNSSSISMESSTSEILLSSIELSSFSFPTSSSLTGSNTFL